MNQTIEVIMKRRAVRLYESKPIPKETLQILIDAGNAAPSGGNAQNWRFVVVEDKDFKNKLVSLAIPKAKKFVKALKVSANMRKKIDEVSSHSDPIYYGAPAIIFVIGTSDFDTPMVCENIMLAARSLDIGSCWVHMGQFPVENQEVRNALEIQEGEKVYGPIILGYPKGDFPESPPKKNAAIKWI